MARNTTSRATRALLLLAAATLAGCEVNLNSEGIVAHEVKTFQVGGPTEIQLETFDGAIEVHSWDRNEVEIDIEKRAMEQSLVDQMRVTAEQQGDRIVVKVSGPSRREFEGIQVGVNFSPSARLRVAVPRQSQLTATSGDGSITVEDVRGKIALTTTDGTVRANRLAGEITVRSGDGAIRMERIEGAIDIETDDGSIVFDGRPSVLRARTSDGSIRVEIEPDSAMNGDWDVETGDGSITLSLPSSFNGLIDAETRDGSVRANHPSLTNETRDGEGRSERRRTLKATLGTGGRTLKVRSGDGTIRIDH